MFGTPLERGSVLVSACPHRELWGELLYVPGLLLWISFPEAPTSDPEDPLRYEASSLWSQGRCSGEKGRPQWPGSYSCPWGYLVPSGGGPAAGRPQGWRGTVARQTSRFLTFILA